MWILFQEGGYPMWFLICFGLLTLISAAAFAHKPKRQKLRLTLGLGVTTLCSIATGVAADVAAVGHQAPDYLKAHPTESLATVLLQGVAESLSPAIFGGFILTIVALWVSVGLWRGYTD
ncbi:MAG TPA: hypothetical protein VHM70_06830 [Polyangiaceae bacterium]|nr:hypothetical protein [Polyangiaceae bacterium]